MSVLITCEHISHAWPTKKVFKDQTLGIHTNTSIGIVGRNGDGKSTLLNIIAKKIVPDEGQVIWRSNLRVGMLGQADELEDDKSVIYNIVKDMPEYEWASDPYIRDVLAHLLAGIDQNAVVLTLSGGQRRRVDLARLLCQDWDVLLLDEPTNHLDMSTISWLSQFLQNKFVHSDKALLVVTHDRWFLDTVCTYMWEVHDATVEPFEGGYSAYIQQRAERAEQAERREAKRRNILRKELAWLVRAPKSRGTKPRFRVDAARELIADEPEPKQSLQLHRLPIARLGKQVFELKNVSFAYTNSTCSKEILHDVSWIIGPGQRIGILGENGIGKSSLLRLLAHELTPTQGNIKEGKSVEPAYMSQRLESFVDRQDERCEDILQDYPQTYYINDKPISARQMFEELGFNRRDLRLFIHQLSGGQLRRFALLCTLLKQPNVLILDEPANDMDTDMLALMENVLDGWPGTLIVVSHDRWFLERVCDDMYALIDKSIVHMPAGTEQYFDYLAHAQSHNKISENCEKQAKQAQTNTLTNKQRQQYKKRFSAIDRKLIKLRDELTDIEASFTHIDPCDFEMLQQKTQEKDKLIQQIEDMEDEWLELSCKLEEN